MTTEQLPVQALIEPLVKLLPAARVVIEAPPGAGKSTLLPLALLQQPSLAQQRILMLQPRRLATLAIATYLARQLDEPVGQTVGYHIRGEARFNQHTRLLIVTEGMFTQYLQQDPELAGVGMVIFDEFHERNLASDLGLAMLQESLLLRPDLSVLVMSATLPAEPIAAWLSEAGVDCQILRSEGRQYPISIHYRPPPASSRWQQHLPQVIQEACQVAQQDVLVFVPGLADIQYVTRSLNEQLQEQWQVYPLHRQVAPAAQRDVLRGRQGEGKRRIILATNIAETSVTIPGVDVVVDSGRERQALYYPQHGVSRLVTRRISKASATQRAGRAGRTAAGVCFRVWAEADQHGLRDYQVPELETADLTSLLLECKRWGSEPAQLRFFTPPSAANLAAAQQTLVNLQAVQENGRLTALGQQLSELGSDPRLARIIAHAQSQSASYRATVAYLIAQLEQLPRQPQQFPQPLAQFNSAQQQRYQYWLKRLGITASERLLPPSAFAEILLWGFADRVGLQRAKSDRYLLAYGGGASFHHQDLRQPSRWLLVLTVNFSEGQADAIIGAALELTEADLTHPALTISSYDETTWSGPSKRLQTTRWQQLGAIKFNPQPVAQLPSAEQRIQALRDYVQQQGLAVLGWSASCQQWLARARLLEQHLPAAQQAQWPSFSEAHLLTSLADWASPYWQDITSLQQLTQWRPLTALQARLNYSQQQLLQQACPSHLRLPSGREQTIDYTQATPLIAVKLQEMFGEPVSPTLCFGQVTLTIDLLSPAGRLLQRTADLASFWNDAYTAVKKEMKGRYPKHPWPDQPHLAMATHKTKRHLE